MTLDIILLIGTIVVAVAAVIVGLIRAVLERRRQPLGAQYRSRRIDPQRLERAVPGPTAKDGTIRALEKQAPAMGSRPAFATLGAPVAVAVTPEPADESDLVDASPAHPYAYAYARESDEPDAEIDAVVIEPAMIVADPETKLEVEPEPESKSEPQPEPEPGLSDAAMAELGIVASRKRSGKAAKAAAVSPAPVDEPALSTEPAAEPAAEPVEPAAAAATSVDEPAMPAAASAEPVPLFLPGTYTPGAADLEEPALKRDDAPTRAAAMTAGYAPTARAVFVPPPPDVIEDELAYRIGVPGAHRPSQPAALEVAGGPEALAPVLPTVETEAWPERRGRARRRAAISMTAIAAAVVVAIGAATLPGLLDQGGVLSETGRPQVSGGGVALETPSPTPPPATSQPTLSPPPGASPSPAATPSSAAPSPSASPAASSGSVKTASVTPRPPAAPPAATPTPTPKVTAKPTKKPLRPPIAFFQCTSEGLTLHCDGSRSDNAASYVWEFSEGPSQSGVQASHTYLLPGSYLVTLTVTNPAGSDSDSHAYTVTIL